MALLNIPDAMYDALAAEAAARHLTLDEFVLPLLDGVKSLPQLPLDGEAWEAAMEAMDREARSREGRYPPGFVLDDSREAMYFGDPEGRG